MRNLFILPVTVVIVSSLIAIACAESTGDSNLSKEDRLLSRAQVIARKDCDRAVALATQSAEAGHVPSMLALGNFYARGRLVPAVFNGPDTSTVDMDEYRDGEAAAWFNKAVERAIAQGDTTNVLTAAMILRTNLTGRSDKERAYDLTAQLVERDMHTASRMIVFWSIGDHKLDSAQEWIDRAKSDNRHFAYGLQSYLNTVHEPSNVILAAEPLVEGEHLGMATSARALMKMAYHLKVAANDGSEEANASVSKLKAAGYWREPTPDFVAKEVW